MKKTLLCVLFLVFVVSYTQGQDYTFSFQQVLLIDAFGQLEERSDFRFQYAAPWLDSLFVNGSFSGSMDNVVRQMLQGTPLGFVVQDRFIILTRDQQVRTELPIGFFQTQSANQVENVATGIFLREATQDEEQDTEVEIVRIGQSAQATRGQYLNLAGFVRELDSGEPIPGALVYLKEPFIGVTTDQRGYYSIQLPSGQNLLNVQFAGMRDIAQLIQLNESGTYDFTMEDDVIALKEVTIESERDANVDAVDMGLNTIEVKAIKNIPLVLGEPDVLKVAETLPGVQTLGEGAAGFNVRGGRVDQNLISVNGATIYNPYHFFGFFSILNSSVIKKLDVYKGSIPAKFGGRLSSYFDIQMKDGNQNKWTGSASISPVTAGLTLEGPIVKDKTSVIFGGRTTYSNWVLRLLPDSEIKNSDVFFYDVVGKITHKMSDKDQLMVSGYFSKDRFNLSSDSIFSYQNANGAAVWRHNFNNNFISEVSASISDYRYNIDFRAQPVNNFNSGFQINELKGNLDFTYFLNASHKLDFGYQTTLYRLKPGFIEPANPESLVIPETVEDEKGWENAFYIADNFEISPRLTLYLGLRYSIFSAMGPQTVYTFNPNFPRSPSTITDTTNVDGNQIYQTYHGPEYRVSARYKINEELSIKAAYNRTRQYIHQLSNTVALAPH